MKRYPTKARAQYSSVLRELWQRVTEISTVIWLIVAASAMTVYSGMRHDGIGTALCMIVLFIGIWLQWEER